MIDYSYREGWIETIYHEDYFGDRSNPLKNVSFKKKPDIYIVYKINIQSYLMFY